jgi:hypothetical protein
MGRLTVEHGSDGESWGYATRLIQPAIRIQGGSGPPDGCPLRKAIVSDSSGREVHPVPIHHPCVLNYWCAHGRYGFKNHKKSAGFHKN